MKVTCFFKYKKIIINIFIYFIIFYFLFNSKVLVSSITSSINIFTTKLIPALFPYILITELLINSGKVNNLSFGLEQILSKIFNIPSHICPGVIIGFLLGYPNCAKYIATLYTQNNIDTKTATKLISFTSNANLSYIIASIGLGVFNNFSIGIILAISHFLSSIIIGIFFNRSYNNIIIQQSSTNSNTFCKIYSPFELLTKSISGTLKTLAYIFSYTVVFSLIPHVLVANTNIPQTLKALVTGIAEISNGISEVYLLNLALNLKLTIISFILSFSSFMILTQIFSFAHIAKIKFRSLVKYKLIQGFLSGFITYVITTYIYPFTSSVSLNNDLFISRLGLLPSTVYMFSIFVTVVLSLLLFRKKRHA